MPGTSVISRIGLADLHRVRALAHVIWPECYGDIIAADRLPAMLAEIYAPATLAADITERGHCYWLASRDGRDLGYASAYLEDGRIWIKKLYLLAEARGLGLGKQFIAAARARFGAHYPQALYVNDGNAAAIGFYRAQGFAVEARVPVRMGPYDFEDYLMVRPA